MSDRVGGAARGGEGRGGQGGRGGRGRGRGGRNNNNQRGRARPKHVSKTPAIKDDVFDCGSAASAAQFEKSNKAIIEYIRREGSKEPIIIAEALETGVAPTIVVPPAPPQIPDPNNPGLMIDDQAEIFMWQSTLKQVPVRRVNLAEGLVTAYTIYLDQCSPTVRSKLEQLADWPQISQDKDPLRLKAEIRNIMCGRESHQEPTYSMVQLIKMLVNLTQESMSNERYKEVFEGLWDAHIQQGGNLGNQPGLIQAEAQLIAGAGAVPGPADIAEATAIVESKIKACFMLSGADNSRHKELKQAHIRWDVTSSQRTRQTY
jgi:hypothetical protein